jgi:hypothetical protein
MTDDDFRTLRCYLPAEAVVLLQIKPTWLKEWITKRAIPLQLSGTERGVWFTYEDLQTIGRMLPALMTERQENARARSGKPATARLDSSTIPAPCEVAGTPGELAGERPELATLPTAGPSADEMLRFASMRSVRRAP